MPDCPVCGWQMDKAELRRGTFACPGCKRRLHWPEPSRLEISLLFAGGVLLAFLIPHWAGASAGTVLWVGLVLFLPTSCILGGVLGALRGFLFPRKLEVASEPTPEVVSGKILDITAPPDRPRDASPSHEHDPE